MKYVFDTPAWLRDYKEDSGRDFKGRISMDMLVKWSDMPWDYFINPVHGPYECDRRPSGKFDREGFADLIRQGKPGYMSLEMWAKELGIPYKTLGVWLYQKGSPTVDQYLQVAERAGYLPHDFLV